MGFLKKMLQKITGGESDDEVPTAEDEEFALLYEACTNGNLPIITDAPIILKRGETAHFVSPVSVVEQKTETTTYRAYAGTRMKVGSVPFYLGGSVPSKVSKEVLAPIGKGHIIITNKRVILTGTKINYSTSLDKVTHCKRYTDAIQILWEGRYGGRFYKMDDPRPAVLILETLTSGVPSPGSIGLDSSMFPTDPKLFVGFAAEGLTDDVVELLDKGMDVNSTMGELGITALMAAANKGHSDLVSLLLERGADPDIRTDDGDTALIGAALDGHSDIVSLLLGAGAKVDAKDKNGTTALMAAAWNGHHEVVEILLQNGADVNAKTPEGVTAVTFASEDGHQEVVKLLIAAGAREASDDSDVSQDADYFIEAAFEGRADVVEDLLNKGFDVNLTRQDGTTALCAAAYQGQVEVLKLLLERGAAINEKGMEGVTALMMAAGEGRADAVKLLAERSGKINAKNKNGLTPLMFAAANGHDEVVEILLQNGADVNAKTPEGGTALDLASAGGHQEVVKLLIAAGARYALDDSNVSQDPDYFVGAAADGREDVITRLLDKGTDVNLTAENGDTALIAAAIHDQVEVLQLLLQRGADINNKNNDGLTALIMAASEGRANAVRFLAERSGEINVNTEDGATPLMFAALNGHSEAVEILLQGGADPNAKTKAGATALDAAIHGGHPKVAELFRAYGAKG